MRYAHAGRSRDLVREWNGVGRERDGAERERCRCDNVSMLDENTDEAHAAGVVGRVLDTALVRLAGESRADYECPVMDVVLEVKRVTSEAMLAGLADGGEPRQARTLRHGWWVSVQLPTLDVLLPTGEIDPPQDPVVLPPPESGLVLRSRAERMQQPDPLTVEQLKAQYRPRTATAKALIPALEALESLEVFDHMKLWDAMPQDTQAPGWLDTYRKVHAVDHTLRAVTNSSICFVDESLAPGLHLNYGWGASYPLRRDLCAEILARRMESFLHSNFKAAVKLVTQLQRETHTGRHAALIIDGSEPTHEGFLGCLADGAQPTYVMELPEPLTDVWVMSVQSTACWRYSVAGGWSIHAEANA